MISPIKNLVLVKFEPKKFESDTGIILKTQKRIVADRPTCGVIEALGPDADANLKVGDFVYFENISGQDIDANHLMLKDFTILGKSEKN